MNNNFCHKNSVLVLAESTVDSHCWPITEMSTYKNIFYQRYLDIYQIFSLKNELANIYQLLKFLSQNV